LDSVKKIVYLKKNDRNLTYAPTVESAVQYANAGMLEEWIQCYLLFTHKVIPFQNDFMKGEHLCIGVVKFPLRLIQSQVLKLDEKHATEDDGHAAALPPLLLQYEEGKFHCNFQIKLLTTLKKRKVDAYPTIIVMKGNEDYKRFMKYYGTVFFYVDKV